MANKHGGPKGSRDGYKRGDSLKAFPPGTYNGAAAINSDKFIEGIKERLVPTLYRDTINVYFDDAEKEIWDGMQSRKPKKILKIEYCASHIRDRSLGEQTNEMDVLGWMREYSQELELKDESRGDLEDLFNEIETIFIKDLERAKEYLI